MLQYIIMLHFRLYRYFAAHSGRVSLIRTKVSNTCPRPMLSALVEPSLPMVAGSPLVAMRRSTSLTLQWAMASRAFVTYLAHQQMRPRMEVTGASQETSSPPLDGTLALKQCLMVPSLSLLGASTDSTLQYLLTTTLRMRFWISMASAMVRALQWIF